jgi:hypothetical protein
VARWIIPVAAWLATLTLVAPARAQLGYFGRNKVQYRSFDWQVLKGEHIDVHFYPEERELASLTLAYTEESFRVLERKFGHSPRRRIPLIIYALHADFEQTNILPFVPPEGILGVTEFLKRRVAVPFNGNYAEFRHTLRHELVHAFQLSVLTESRIRYPRTARPSLPLWWSEGLAEYWSGGEDALDEAVLRDITLSGRMPKLRSLALLTSGLVYPLGGAIHRWLGERFGAWRVQVLYRDLWKYRTFADALEGVYGVPITELENELAFHFQQTYYPQVADRQPLDVAAMPLAEVAVKPVAYRLPGDSVTRYLYLSPRSGYMNIYSGILGAPDQRTIEVKGERSEQFESFHSQASRLEVQEGIAVFSSRYLDRDALFFWDLTENRVVGRYQFPELVSILSPTWAPDGESVVFSGLTTSGYSDLYRLWIAEERREQLTADRYQDIDPSFSPDGASIVFASDRTPFGPDGALNLYVLDLSGNERRPLTFGAWRDQSPRWATDGRIYFASDRLGVFDIYSVDPEGHGRRETNALTGAFDPQWVAEEQSLLYSGFSDLTFKVYRGAPDHSARANGQVLALPETVDTVTWRWPELVSSPYIRADPEPYEPGLSLDFAFGDAVIAPGVGSAQGIVFQFSDLLSDHLLYVTGSTFQGQNFGSLIDNINGSVFYLNRKHRLNWGAGAFRLRGLFYEGDFATLYEETSVGGFGSVRWPFSRFKRVEGQIRIERSNRFDISRLVQDGDQRRVGWLASNFVSYVHDNSLWLPSGPIDGSRTNVTAGLTNDLSNGRFDSWTLSLDHREYWRIGLQTTYAVRALGYYAGGSRPRRVSIGGPWGMRGYPRIGNVGGSRAFMLNQELRFPITNFVSLGFPFGEVRFPGVQGALFVDVGGAWNAQSVGRSIIGSGGFGLRMPIGFPLVLRLDMGWRFAFGDTFGYSVVDPSEDRWFVDFFFGFNY